MKKLILIATAFLVGCIFSMAQQFLSHNLLDSGRLATLPEEIIFLDAARDKDLIVSERTIVSPRTLVIFGIVRVQKPFGRLYWLGIP
ncbi:hypothetical protein RT717_16580 [Imperialibacter roseus]|uniref:Lipoprotein n=1 Tax=Imperialibacter roseus TaxID=1324217 RepID=A0ABZ0II43_9BACT|nr:hypothetical protein [Imperialibacter roseus]WOK04698.1 hypothetical protein RT717_16580 [Imperialibacter roseus]